MIIFQDKFSYNSHNELGQVRYCCCRCSSNVLFRVIYLKDAHRGSGPFSMNMSTNAPYQEVTLITNSIA